MDRSTILNFNVGVLGHIDSGKTSLGASACNIYSMHATVDDTFRSYDKGALFGELITIVCGLKNTWQKITTR